MNPHVGKRKILTDAEIGRFAPAMQIIVDHLAKHKDERTVILQSLIQAYFKHSHKPLKILKYME
jgi:hypothetical protein